MGKRLKSILFSNTCKELSWIQRNNKTSPYPETVGDHLVTQVNKDVIDVERLGGDVLGQGDLLVVVSDDAHNLLENKEEPSQSMTLNNIKIDKQIFKWE